MSKSKSLLIAGIMTGMLLAVFLWNQKHSEPEHTEIIQEQPLRFGVFRGDAGALAWVAQDQGYFVKHQVSVDFQSYTTGKRTLSDVQTGQLDLATSSEFVFVNQTLTPTDLQIVGNIATFRTHNLIVRNDRNIQQPSDLKGKKIGLIKGTGGEFGLNRFLIRNGLSGNDLDLIDLPASQLEHKLETGEMDAVMTWQPVGYQILQKMGDQVSVMKGTNEQEFYFVLVARQDWIVKHVEELHRVLYALNDAENFIRLHPDEFRKILARQFELTDDYITDLSGRSQYTLDMPQALILAMEDEAQWLMESNPDAGMVLPNYLKMISLDAMQQVKPEAITLIR
ncbi:MAG: NrtA/SsuA/CpmA family ABC transporter substrate-binding protein [SAR324 cluster bacterium]|nr:NrtA/SsuA/CpmA family ABC transporter substrate-binding protein [SAR324 cluster bacterium]